MRSHARRTIVQAPEPVTVTIVGLATFGTEDGLGAVTFTAFTLEGAETHVTKRPGMASAIVLRAQPGVDHQALAERVRPLAGDGNQLLVEELAADVVAALGPRPSSP